MRRRMAAGAVEHVIRKFCLRAWSHPCEWILALPVLHFLRHDLRPFETPETTDLNSPQWWGLENLLEEVKTSRLDFSNAPGSRITNNYAQIAPDSY